MNGELIVLRLIHILGGIFWVGAGIFTTFFLMPALKDSGPAAAQVMMGLQRRKLLVVMPLVAILTILTGIRLLMIASRNFGPEFFNLPSGKVFAGSGLLALLAFIVGMAVQRPSMSKVANLNSMAVSDEVNRTRILEEIQAIQKRVVLAGRVTTILIAIAAAGMAVARYL